MNAIEAPAGYRPSGGAWDEAFDRDGAVRRVYAGVLAALQAASPSAAAEAISVGVKRDGVVHGADADAHPLAVDAVPRVFAAEEWARLEAGLAQRVGALAANNSRSPNRMTWGKQARARRLTR